jgi:hypothetical protein
MGRLDLLRVDLAANKCYAGECFSTEDDDFSVIFARLAPVPLTWRSVRDRRLWAAWGHELEPTLLASMHDTVRTLLCARHWFMTTRQRLRHRIVALTLNHFLAKPVVDLICTFEGASPRLSLA